MPHKDDSNSTEPPSRFKRWVKRAWWLHSCFALSFGIGVMIVARRGLEFADKILIVLSVSWLLMFVALRFIVGPGNRIEGEGLTRRGVRVVTNYVIKNLYQQMFFFLVPLYASSATWSLASWNWWLVPVLLACAVLSTMDLVFDHFIMERRVIASAMYGLALFGVLNLILPLVFGFEHFFSLLIAAGATAPAVALLNFRVKSIITGAGLLSVSGATAALIGLAWVGRAAVPPAPLAMVGGAVGHGSLGSYECLPSSKTTMRADRLDKLRCGSVVVEPGGLRDSIVHVWRHEGSVVKIVEPTLLPDCHAIVAQSYLPAAALPADPTGHWECRVETADRQLVGLMKFEVIAAPAAAASNAQPPAGSPGAPSSDAGPAAPDAPSAPPDAPSAQ